MPHLKAGIVCFATIATAMLLSAGAERPADTASSPSTQPSPTHNPAPRVSGLPAWDQAGHRRWKDYQQMHAYFVEGFINTEGEGLGRMPTPRSMARFSTLYIDGVDYRIGNVQLISIPDDANPFVYDTPADASMKSIHRAARRPLLPHEITAVRQLKAGSHAVLVADGTRPVLVGALRATESCLACHEGTKGDLLGAFTYPLVPDQPLFIETLKPTTRPATSSGH